MKAGGAAVTFPLWNDSRTTTGVEESGQNEDHADERLRTLLERAGRSIVGRRTRIGRAKVSGAPLGA